VWQTTRFKALWFKRFQKRSSDTARNWRQTDKRHRTEKEREREIGMNEVGMADETRSTNLGFKSKVIEKRDPRKRTKSNDRF
jgi:hypothetical protein